MAPDLQKLGGRLVQRVSTMTGEPVETDRASSIRPQVAGHGIEDAFGIIGTETLARIGVSTGDRT